MMLEQDDELTQEQLERLLTKERVLDFSTYVMKSIEPTKDEPLDIDDAMRFTNASTDDLLTLREVKPH